MLVVYEVIEYEGRQEWSRGFFARKESGEEVAKELNETKYKKHLKLDIFGSVLQGAECIPRYVRGEINMGNFRWRSEEEGPEERENRLLIEEIEERQRKEEESDNMRSFFREIEDRAKEKKREAEDEEIRAWHLRQARGEVK